MVFPLINILTLLKTIHGISRFQILLRLDDRMTKCDNCRFEHFLSMWGKCERFYEYCKRIADLQVGETLKEEVILSDR